MDRLKGFLVGVVGQGACPEVAVVLGGLGG